MLIPRATARLVAFWTRLGSVIRLPSISGTSLIPCPLTVAGRIASRVGSIGTAGDAPGDPAGDDPTDELPVGVAVASVAGMDGVGAARVGLGDGVALAPQAPSRRVPTSAAASAPWGRRRRIIRARDEGRET